MTQHTPGPWTVFETEDMDERTCLQVSTTRMDDGGQDDSLATVYDLSDEGCANARLITAAPDLLAALERSAEAAHALTGNPVCERHSLRECPTSYCAKAHAAIAKAEEGS